MADLPEDRLTPAPPFTYVGMDYFGPYVTKEGRKERKRYGAKFTCLVSRAVHIAWETQIRTARRILDTLLREHGSRLDDESLQTLMCEVESIIN